MDLGPLLEREVQHDGSFVEMIRFSPDGSLLAAVDDGSKSRVLVWEAATGRWLGEVPARRVLGFEPGAPVVVVARRASTVWWDCKARRAVRTLEGFGATSWSADRSRLVGLGSDGIQVRTAEGALVASWPLEGDSLPQEGLAISPDGSWVGQVLGGDLLVFEAETGTLRRRLSTLSQRDATCVDFAPGLVAFGTMGGTLALHELPTGDVRFQHPLGAEIRSVHFSADGRLLAAGCADLHEKAFVHSLTGGGPPLVADRGDDSFSVRFSPEGSRLAVGGASGTIRLYRLPLQAAAVDRMPNLESGLGAVSWAHEAGRPDTVLELVPALRQRFPVPKPELAGWLAHYEYQALYSLGRWQEAWDAMAPVGTPGCVVTPANEAFRHSVAVELAFRLGRFDEIPSHADRCMEIRRDLGDEEGVELCRRMTERCLREAGRADPARRHGEGWVSRIAGWFGRS